MGVAATLPELSECTTTDSISHTISMTVNLYQLTVEADPNNHKI